jgi:hypothetical protein
MNKFLFAAAILAVSFSQTAIAQEPRQGFQNFVERVTEDMEVTYGLGAGFPFPNQNERDEGYTGSVRATFPRESLFLGGNQRVGFETAAGENDGVQNDDIAYQSLMGVWELEYPDVPLLSNYGVEPYVTAGAGVLRLEGRGAEVGDHFAFQYGAGFNKYVSERTAVGARVSNVHSAGDVVDDRGSFSNLNVTNVVATLTYDF